MASSEETARAAGRGFGGMAMRTAMAGGGGLLYFGAHAVSTPMIYGGNDPKKIPGRCWILPLVGVVAGAAVSAVRPVQALGEGIVGGALALGGQQVQVGIQLAKAQKQQAAAAAPAAPTRAETGALLEPRDVYASRPMPQDTGALYAPPDYSAMSAMGMHELAGLSI